MRRVVIPVAIAASLIGCASRSTPLPFAGSPVAQPAAQTAAHTGVIYSTPEGIVYPERLFPSLHRHGLLVPRAGTFLYVMEVAGITQGSSTLKGYINWGDLISFSLGFGPPSGNHRSVAEIVVTKDTDISSPMLFNGLVSGKKFTGPDPGGGSNKTELVVLDENGGRWSEFIWFDFTSPIATLFSTQWTGTALPLDTVNIAFTKATVCVKSTSGGSPVCSIWSPTGPAE
jgi:type VI protein secretion system component Hcp